MRREFMRFLAFLLLAAGMHLAVAWVWGRWSSRWEAVKLPKLDLTSVELSLKSEDAVSRQPSVASGGGVVRPQPETMMEVPPPKLSENVKSPIETEIKSTPPPPPEVVAEALPTPKPEVVAEALPPHKPESTASEASAEESAKVEVPPAPLAKFHPRYPDSCRRRGEEGVVALDVEVDVKGYAAEVTVVESSGFAKLDAAAVAAVQSARFTPALVGGKPAAGSIRIPIAFRLTN